MMCRTTRPAGLRGRGIRIILGSLRRDRGLFSSRLRPRVGSNTRPWTFAMHWMHWGIIEQAKAMIAATQVLRAQEIAGFHPCGKELSTL